MCDSNEMANRYRSVVEALFKLPRITDKHEVDHTRELLEHLGNPQDAMSVIHVAGTNGKGSVCAMLSSILHLRGCPVGLFTSPHLIEPTERIRIDEVDVEPETFVEAYDEVEAVVASSGMPHPTFFETMFLMSLVIFRKRGVRVAVIETGLGGRLDATNAIERPGLVILTSISKDHREYLGNTIAQIAAEKAGIIKRGVPVIFVDRNAQATQVIEDRAKEMLTPMRKVSARNYTILRQQLPTKKHPQGRIRIATSEWSGQEYKITVPSVGLYQAENVTLLLAALDLLVHGNAASDEHYRMLGHHLRDLDMETIQEGIDRMRWKGRMQWIGEKILLDGAHNSAGAKALARSLSMLAHRPLHLLFAVSQTKDYDHMVQILSEIDWESVTVTRLGSVPSCDLEELEELFVRYGFRNVEVKDEPRLAFDFARDRCRDDEMLMVAGSLYLVGDVNAWQEGR